jgi:hypothetical protein
MNKRLISLAAVLTIGLACGIAFAGPAWRGTAQSTFQEWSSWTTSSGYVAPDAGWQNPFGTPTMFVKTGELDLVIPNNPLFLPDLPKSEMRIEVESLSAALISFSFDYTGEIIRPPMTPGFDIIQSSKTVDGNGWYTTIFDFLSWPKPVKETIVIKNFTAADRVTIDTRCIPEPATLLLLGLGAAITTRKKIAKNTKKDKEN